MQMPLKRSRVQFQLKNQSKVKDPSPKLKDEDPLSLRISVSLCVLALPLPPRISPPLPLINAVAVVKDTNAAKAAVPRRKNTVTADSDSRATGTIL